MYLCDEDIEDVYVIKSKSNEIMSEDNAKRLEMRRSRVAVMDLIYILIGSFLQALAYAAFIAPNNIVPGGVYGITIALNHITKGLFAFAPDGLPIGSTALFFNVPLLYLAAKKLGMNSLWRSIVTFISIALFTDLITSFITQHPVLPDDRLLSAFYGGAILGTGVFLIFKANGTSAGTDVLCRVISKGRNLKLSEVIIVVDSIVVLFGLFAFRDWSVPLYSWLTIFIYGLVVNFLQPENPKKSVFIVSEKQEVIKQMLVHEMHLRGTIINGKGMYRAAEREILFLITERKILPKLKMKVLVIDPKAFISTMDASHDPTDVLLDHEA